MITFMTYRNGAPYGVVTLRCGPSAGYSWDRSVADLADKIRRTLNETTLGDWTVRYVEHYDVAEDVEEWAEHNRGGHL